jgi:hypothetical protein
MDCRNTMRNGANNPKWRGGRVLNSGYVYIYKPEHPYATNLGYVLEHRLVMENILGRYLMPEEVVNHENEITDDNTPSNLVLYSSCGKHSIDNHIIRDISGRFASHMEVYLG